jgi:hypothetical protein
MDKNELFAQRFKEVLAKAPLSQHSQEELAELLTYIEEIGLTHESMTLENKVRHNLIRANYKDYSPAKPKDLEPIPHETNLPNPMQGVEPTSGPKDPPLNISDIFNLAVDFLRNWMVNIREGNNSPIASAGFDKGFIYAILITIVILILKQIGLF